MVRLPLGLDAKAWKEVLLVKFANAALDGARMVTFEIFARELATPG